MFLIITAGVLIANLGRQAIPPLLPTIMDELAITAAAAGFALTLMRVWFAVLQYPSGRLADVVSRKLAIVSGLGVMILGFLVLSITHTYLVLLVSTTLLGIGSAFFFVSERVLLSDLFVEKRGRAFGFNSSLSRIGSILAAGLAVVALGYSHWQLAFIPVAVLLTGVVIVFHVGSREPYHSKKVNAVTHETGDGGVRETVSRVFSSTQVRGLVVAYTLIIFAWEGILAFLPAYLQAAKGLSLSIASGGFAMLFAVGVIVQPISGTMSDRWDRRLVGGIATFGSAIGLAILIGSNSLTVILPGIILYAGGMMAFTPVIQAYLLDIFSDTTKGGDLGAFKTVYEGLSSLGPTYVGITIGVMGYDAAFLGLLVCLVVSTLILFWLTR